ncbi:MAG: DUF937 domain-containing protein [Saprospiraceae bacterium]|nr:DUF937 domain-containing protein [Saprospiraceae bacterium]
MDLMDLMQGQLSQGLLDQLSNQIGVDDKQKTATAATGIISTLMTAMAKNAQNPQGAASLANALEKDHDGSILDNISGLLNGNIGQTNQRAANGEGIIKHILGERQNGAVNMISQMSGLDSNKTSNLMTMLAPILMGMLGQQKKQQGLDVGGIASLLMNNVQQGQGSNPLMDMATRFLDQDGDGSVVDDILGGLGKKFLGNLFGGK